MTIHDAQAEALLRKIIAEAKQAGFLDIQDQFLNIDVMVDLDAEDVQLLRSIRADS